MNAPLLLPPFGWALVALVACAVSLAACAAWLQAAGGRAERRRAARWASWEPVLLDVLVEALPPGAFASDIAAAERGDALALLTAYALRLTGDSRALLARTAAPLLDSGRARLADRRGDRRAFAVRLLGLLGSATDGPALVAALADPSPDVAMMAARALARSHDASTVAPVLVALDRFAAWGTPAVASMLAAYGLPAGPALADAFADARHPGAARVACAEALRRLGYFPAAGVAVGVLEDAVATLDLRAAALRLLRDVGDATHAPVVRRLVDSPDAVERMHAVSALAALSHRPADVARLASALGDASPWVAQRAARGLLEAGCGDALRALASRDDARGALARQALIEATTATR